MPAIPNPPRAATVLRRPAVRRWVIARVASGAATTMVRAVVLWQVYVLSRSAAVLGLVGLISFVPGPVASLLGGVVADGHDRRRVVLIAQSVGLACALALAALSASGRATVGSVLAIVVVSSAAFAFEAPARQALLPGLVPKEELSRAVTVMSTGQALALVSGPAIGGVLVAARGPGLAYAVATALFVVSLAFVLRVASPPLATRRAVSFSGLVEGLRFVRGQPVVLAAMTVDLFAVVFGGATALLPVYATDILRVGATGYGLLSSSLEIGALATSVALILFPPMERLGRAILLSVAVYGLATIAFGLSRSFPLSVAVYALVGVADQVSVVGRNTLVQLATPDELRGRVSSVNMIFIGASNQLSVAEAGFVAALTTPTFSVVSGGCGVLIVVALVARVAPSLWRFRAPSA